MINCAETMQCEALIGIFGGNRLLDYFLSQGQITRVYRSVTGGVVVDYFPIIQSEVRTIRVVGKLGLK